MTITFIGHGYVGLVTACIFADFGNTVYVIGHTPEKLERLRSGDPIIYEPGLQELLKKNLKAGRLRFTDQYDQAMQESEIVFIAVGTPSKKSGEADLSVVFEVAEEIGKHLAHKFTVVSCKSTVPIGTNRRIEKIIKKVKPVDAEFAVASCPEFLREGTGIHDTLEADRVVIGSDSKRAIDVLMKVHEPISGQRVVTDLTSAELIKYTANAMLATKISFANLISFYCEKMGADVETVLDGVGLDKRIGRVFMYPGVGYGGACFPKDVKAIINIGKHLSIDTLLLDSVERVNFQSRVNYVQKVFEHLKGNKVAIWGLSFKPNTDDIREAPSLHLIDKLLEEEYEVHVFDPVAMDNVRKQYGDRIHYHDDPYSPTESADILCILTEWNEFRQADLQKVKKNMKKPLIIDGRNIYHPEEIKKLGFTYVSTGRRTVNGSV